MLINTILLVILVILVILIYLYLTRTHRVSYHTYDVMEIPHFLSDQECDILVNLSKEKLVPSRVYSSESDRLDETHRKSEQCWLKDDIHPLVEHITKKSLDQTQTHTHHNEELQIVRYKQGGFFNPHYDPCDGTYEICKRLDGEHGPRMVTVLIYLNDDYLGGETVFPKINKTIVPEKGKAVVFYSSDPKGRLIVQSFHGGNPVIQGEKWIANKWIKIREIIKVKKK